MKWLKWGRGNSRNIGQISPAIFEGELGKFIRSNQVFKNLAQARAMRALNRQHEADSQFDAALKVAEKLRSESPSNDPWPIILRGHILKEADLLDNALQDYRQVLDDSKYILSDDHRLTVSAQALEIERILGQKVHQPITSVYVCYDCGALINFATAKCPHCENLVSDQHELSMAMVGSSDLMGAHNLIHLSRGIRDGRKPSDLIANLSVVAARRWQTYVKSGIDKKLLDILEGGRTELTPDLHRVMSCIACGQEVSGSGIDKCEHCGEVISKSEVEKTLIALTKIKLAIETRLVIVESLQYDRFIESVVYLWSYLLREQKSVSKTIARRIIAVMRELKTLRFENNGAFYDLSASGEVTIHVVADNLQSKEEAIPAMLIGFELNQLASLMAKIGSTG